MSRVIFWGGTGQAKVMRGVAQAAGIDLVAVFDDTPGLMPPFADVPLVLGSGFERWLASADRRDLSFCVAIGNPHGRVRLRIHDRLVQHGLRPATLVHPTAWISPRATIGAGAQIHAGAIIETDAVLGRQCIVNTKASVDHECVLGDGVEIAPGATLCGSIRLGTAAWICAGATIGPRLTIGDDATVAAGAVVLCDVAAGATVAGVPARSIQRTNERGAGR